MSTDAAAIQNSTEVRYPPGDLAIWIFILAELAVFAIFFSGYAFARLNNVELFNEYQQLLDRRSAFINTLALITSSFFVVRAVAAIREGDSRVCVRWLLAALLMGVIFLLVKSAEYAHHLGQGVTLSTNTFYMFYLSLTFFHFMHVIMGMVILAAVAWKANQGGYSAAEYNAETHYSWSAGLYLGLDYHDAVVAGDLYHRATGAQRPAHFTAGAGLCPV
jgi:nitric oxide reductase NorE protein